MRLCTKCQQQKSPECFGTHKWCKDCFAAYCRERRQRQTPDERRAALDKRNAWVAENKERVRSKERAAARKRYAENPDKGWAKHLKYDYNITPDQWFFMLEKQGGVCGICGKPPQENQRRFAVDHDHNCCPGFGSCGKCIRGLLCSYCNTKIEFAVDNIEAIERWIGR